MHGFQIDFSFTLPLILTITFSEFRTNPRGETTDPDAHTHADHVSCIMYQFGSHSRYERKIYVNAFIAAPVSQLPVTTDLLINSNTVNYDDDDDGDGKI